MKSRLLKYIFLVRILKTNARTEIHTLAVMQIFRTSDVKVDSSVNRINFLQGFTFYFLLLTFNRKFINIRYRNDIER